MPSSCGDLQTIGHRKSGLYSILGNKSIDSVYCDFTKFPHETGNTNSNNLLVVSVNKLNILNYNPISQNFRNLSDPLESNPHRPISTSRKTIHFHRLTFRFLSKSKNWILEELWIWQLEHLPRPDLERIICPSLDWRYFRHPTNLRI